MKATLTGNGQITIPAKIHEVASMSAPETATTDPIPPALRPRWRRLPISLRMFLLILIVSGVGSLLWWGIPLYRKATAIELIERAGVKLTGIPKKKGWARQLVDEKHKLWFDLVISVHFDQVHVTEAEIQALWRLPELYAVSFGDDMNDDLLVLLQDMTFLQQVYFYDSQITDDGLKHLQRLSQMHNLTLRCPKVTNAGLARISHMQELIELDLVSTQVTDTGLIHLQPFQKLRGLTLRGEGITDAGMVHVAKLKSLNTLRFSQTNIGDAGLETLGGLADMNLIWIEGTKVTDAGLMYLKGMTKLQQINVVDTAVTESGAKALEQAIPGLRVVR